MPRDRHATSATICRRADAEPSAPGGNRTVRGSSLAKRWWASRRWSIDWWSGSEGVATFTRLVTTADVWLVAGAPDPHVNGVHGDPSARIGSGETIHMRLNSFAI